MPDRDRPRVIYTDGDDDNRVPSRFIELLGQVDERAAGGAPVTVAVSDITRLVRTWQALDAVRDRVTAGHMGLLCARQGESGPESVDLLELAELTAFAYDGPRDTLPATSRLALIDRCIERWLVPWLRACGASDMQLWRVREDVGARLRSLAWRWDQPEERDWLVGAFKDVAESHEPEGLPILVRAAALVGVGNSVLEDLHVTEPSIIKQSDWKVITQAAGWYLAEFDEASPGARPDDDPFAGISAARPAAAAAHAGRDFEVMNAMDAEIGKFSADVYARVIDEGIPSWHRA